MPWASQPALSGLCTYLPIPVSRAVFWQRLGWLFQCAKTNCSEINSSARHALGFYKCVANTCQYSVPRARLGGQAVRDVLEAALANVVLAIPSLGVGIAGEETSKPHFVHRPSINLEDHLEYLEKADAPDSDTPDSALLSILQDQHDRSWPDIGNRPPWKLTILTRDAAPEDGSLVFDAVFAVHHSLADGRSTALFHTKLLAELNNPSGPPTQLSGRILTITGPRSLLPPEEELVGFSTSWRFLVQTLWRELGPAWLKWHRPAVPWTGKAVRREPCRTLLRLVTVPAAAMPCILDACRANQATLTPLLHSLVLASLARHVGPEEALAFHSSTPIDLRPFIDMGSQPEGSKGLFGVYVTAQSHDFDAHTIAALREAPSTAEVWKIAADLRGSMKQHLGNVPKDDIVSTLGWLSDWSRFLLAKVGKPRQDTWEVSNLGAMAGGHGEGEEAGAGWKIQRSLMSQGATVSGPAIGVSVSGVAGRGVGIVLGWQEGIVDRETVDGLAGDLQRWLDRLGQGQTEFIEC